MAGTRTAPAATAAATELNASLHLIDASGDLWAESLNLPVAATQAQIEVIASSYAAASNASLYGISVFRGWTGDADPDNAVAAYRAQVESGVNLLFKNLTTLVTAGQRVVAPVPAAMQGNQDIPLLSSTELSDLVLAIIAAKAGFTFSSAQYTGRRERTNNPRIK